MTIPTKIIPSLRAQASHDDPNQDYVIAHREYDIGNMTLAQADLEPRDSLPNNTQHTTDSEFVIFRSRIKNTPGSNTNVAVVSAAKAKFKTTTITGTATQSGTTMTLVSGGPFYPQIVGKTITIAGGSPATSIVASYTSTTVVEMADSQTVNPAAAISFPNADTEMARSRDYRGSKGSYWWARKRFLEDQADTDDLVNELWDSYFLFNTHFPRAYAQRITVLDEDPFVMTKSRITVEYRTAYNPKQYPIGIATQEMYTTNDTKKLLYDLTGTKGTATQSGTTLTLVTGGAFTSGMIGRGVVLSGASPSLTTITGFTNSTTVTVNDSQTITPATAIIVLGKPIETDPDADGYYHGVETGTNIVPDPRVVYVIRTAIERSSLDYALLGTYAGKGNDAAFAKIGGGVDKHTMLCMKVAVSPDYIDDGTDAYIPVQFIFGKYDDDLDTYVTARQRRKTTRKVRVLHPTDDPNSTTRIYEKPDGNTTTTASEAKTRTVVHDGWASDGNEDTSRKGIAYADFSAIDALVSWGP